MGGRGSDQRQRALMHTVGAAQSTLRAHSGRSSRGLVHSRSAPQVSKATSTRRHSAVVPPGQAARHDPRRHTLPVAQSASRTQKVRGEVSTWQNPSTLIWALLVTPSYDRIWDHHFSWPWVSMLTAIDRLRTAPFFYLILNTFGMLIMATIAAYGALRQRGSYALYSACLLLMNLSIVYPYLPYISILRRFTIIFPLYIQLALWGRSRWLTALILCCNTLLWVYISEAYVRFAYLP